MLDAKDHLIVECLRIAVPMWIDRIHSEGGINESHWAFVQDNELLDMVMGRADELLLYKGKNVKEGEVADAFNTLGKAIAVLSFVPNGIEIFDSHWDGTLPHPYTRPTWQNLSDISSAFNLEYHVISTWERLDTLLRKTRFNQTNIIAKCLPLQSKNATTFMHLGRTWTQCSSPTPKTDRPNSETESHMQLSLL